MHRFSFLIRLRRRVKSSLSAKLTSFYGLLFILSVVLIIGCARYGIERYAERVINREMVASTAIFDRITAMQADQMRQGGQVLAGDFGFRSAVATNDAPTIGSALESLKQRLHLSNALMVGLDGSIAGDASTLSAGEREALSTALDEGAEHGVAFWGGKYYSVVSAPIKAPTLVGWVVFANKFDSAELKAIAKLSSLDLHPRIMPIDQVPSGILVAKAGSIAAAERDLDGQRMLLQASPIASFGNDRPHALVLDYSLSHALQAYRPIIWLLLLSGFGGVAIAVAGSWYLARKLTGPIAELDRAAEKVSSGEHAEVVVRTSDELGRLAGSFNKMVDNIEERERQISHMAFHDNLTGLANRALLREHITSSLAVLPSGQSMVLLCLDLDNFKSVNDTLGHPTGDALLCEVARELMDVCPSAFVARLGGDEFAMVIPHGETGAAMLARSINEAIGKPVIVNGHRIVASTSIGMAIAPQDGGDAVTLLKNADLALYRTKNDGKGGFRFFESTMDAEAQKRRELEIELHDAIKKGELELFFQPLFGLSQNRVTAFEALLRWNNPRRGMVSPIEFISLAEETGLIIPIGEWVIREACRVASRWPDQLRVAVNISPVQFRSSALNRIILQALAESGLAPNRLELEITESLFIADVEGTLASLRSLKALGVRVALDDFGTGYSSLSYLRSFPFDKIKIDRSFIVDLLSHDGATAIIRSITTLAEALGMETTAEGVENIDQLDILRDQGCTQIQGYYFSKPIPAKDVDVLLDKYGQTPRKVA